MKTYFILSPATNRVKIGRTRNLPRRFLGMKSTSPDELELLGALDGDRENELHVRFAKDRVRGEWFTLTPAMRVFLKAEINWPPFHAFRERSRDGMVEGCPAAEWYACQAIIDSWRK